MESVTISAIAIADGVKSEECAAAIDGEGEAEVDGRQQEGAGDDERHTTSEAVVDKSEERCQQNGAEGSNARE